MDRRRAVRYAWPTASRRVEAGTRQEHMGSDAGRRYHRSRDGTDTRDHRARSIGGCRDRYRAGRPDAKPPGSCLHLASAIAADVLLGAGGPEGDRSHPGQLVAAVTTVLESVLFGLGVLEDFRECDHYASGGVLDGSGDKGARLCGHVADLGRLGRTASSLA